MLEESIPPPPGTDAKGRPFTYMDTIAPPKPNGYGVYSRQRFDEDVEAYVVRIRENEYYDGAYLRGKRLQDAR